LPLKHYAYFKICRFFQLPEQKEDEHHSPISRNDDFFYWGASGTGAGPGFAGVPSRRFAP
jgi:hypothetical protein